ncbi:hypothetical protein LXL04_020201 [Taraxacum kok-saghyz]
MEDYGWESLHQHHLLECDKSPTTTNLTAEENVINGKCFHGELPGSTVNSPTTASVIEKVINKKHNELRNGMKKICSSKTLIFLFSNKFYVCPVRIETVSHEHTTHAKHKNNKIYSGSVQSPTYNENKIHDACRELRLLVFLPRAAIFDRRPAAIIDRRPAVASHSTISHLKPRNNLHLCFNCASVFPKEF